MGLWTDRAQSFQFPGTLETGGAHPFQRTGTLETGGTQSCQPPVALESGGKQTFWLSRYPQVPWGLGPRRLVLASSWFRPEGWYWYLTTVSVYCCPGL